ncbi:hypothetical protein MTO96_013215 [Rhipicephalus appendiculatus]
MYVLRTRTRAARRLCAPRFFQHASRPAGAARKLPACRRQASQQLPVYTPSRPSGKVTDVSSETAQPASRNARWIYPGFAECRTDLAIEPIERPGTANKRKAQHLKCARIIRERNSNHVRVRDKSSGAGQRCNGNIGRRSAGRSNSAIYCVYRDGHEDTRGGRQAGQASILRERNHRPATRPGGGKKADKIAASMRLSTSLATCKSRDGAPLAVSSILIPLDVAAKLARRTRRAGFYCRETTHRRVEARGVRTGRAPSGAVDLPARLPARPLLAEQRVCVLGASQGKYYPEVSPKATGLRLPQRSDRVWERFGCWPRLSRAHCLRSISCEDH